MITDKDIQKLSKVLATKEDINELAADIVRVEERVEKIEEKVDGIERTMKTFPTRDEFPAFLDKTTMKIEHDRMKLVVEEKLGVKV
jgi:wobble nucleotide-excising tRNase